MPVSLEHMREELLPGLRALHYSFARTKEIYAANVMNTAFDAEFLPLLSAPISLPAAVAVGAAAVVIKNPTVTRRVFSWFNSKTVRGA